MPNNPFRSKKGYVPISGELKDITRRDTAIQQRAVQNATQTNNLGAGNGTPAAVDQGTLGGVDDYTPEDKGRYYG